MEIAPIDLGEDGNPDHQLSGDNLKFRSETIVPYSTNLFYEPIPFEMLRTYEEKPQVVVKVDGYTAVCHSLKCDFTYIDAVGQVTAFTFDADTNKVVITGEQLPSL